MDEIELIQRYLNLSQTFRDLAIKDRKLANELTVALLLIMQHDAAETARLVRESDEKRRAQIREEIMEDLGFCDNTRDEIRALDAIMDGKVRHVKVMLEPDAGEPNFAGMSPSTRAWAMRDAPGGLQGTQRDIKVELSLIAEQLGNPCPKCDGKGKRSTNYKFNKSGEIVDYDEVDCRECGGTGHQSVPGARLKPVGSHVECK